MNDAPNHNETTDHIPSNNNSIIKTVFIITAVYLILGAVATFFPADRLWGFNQAAFTNNMLWLYPILLVIALALYLLSENYFLANDRQPIEGRSSFWIRFPIAGLILILSIVWFYLYSVEGHFFGDGYQLLTGLYNPAIILKPDSYGDLLIHRYVAFDLLDGSAVAVYDSFRFISIFSGVIFVVSVLYYGHKLISSTIGYIIFVLINLFSAFCILFFGYVETYTIIASVMALFVLSSLTSLKNNKKSIVPIITFIIAAFLHKISFFLFPAVVIYILVTFGGEEVKTFVLAKMYFIIAAIFIGGIIVYTAIIIYAPLAVKFMVLPPLADRFTTDGYSLLSTNHIADYINLLFFLIPVFIIFGVLIVGNKKARAEFKRSGQTVYFLTIAISGLLCAFFLNPKLGMARDWDLMSTLLIATQVAAVFLWFEIFQSCRRFIVASIMILLVNISIFIPWLAINSKLETMASYLISEMRLDPKHGRTGFYLMQAMLQTNDRLDDAKLLRDYCDAVFPETKGDKRGLNYLLNNQLDSAEILFRRIIGENPSYYVGYEGLARVQIEKEQYKEAIKNLKISDAINPYSSNTNYYLGSCYLFSDYDIALRYWRRSVEYDSLNPLVNIALGMHYYKYSLPDTALLFLNNIPLESYPPGAVENKVIGDLYEGSGDTARARLFFDRYRHKEP